jgi:hypothetical protein
MRLVSEIKVPFALAAWRRFPLDDALLLFDRDTGWNALCDGPETEGLRQLAPRAVQFAITNVCNLACTFCSRDERAASEWTVGAAFELLRDLDLAGVLEVAFGGGEPWAFPGYSALVRRLHDETGLAVGTTTNGRLLSERKLREVRGCHSQIRLSLYDDVDWREQVRMLRDSGERFGVNLLVTPERLARLENWVLELAALECRDVLLLRYKGVDHALHLGRADAESLGERCAALARALRRHLALKLDVCFGEWLAAAPRLFERADCGAGREFVTLGSDRQLAPCSFHGESWPIANAADVLRTWRDQRERLSAPARIAGCARLAGHGLG